MSIDHVRITYDEFSDNPDVVFRRVLAERMTVWVENAGGGLVEIRPVRQNRRRLRPTEADLQVFYSAAGSWSDVDTDAFVRSVREQRDNSYRPPVDL